MFILKRTEEYRTDSESEAKQLMEKIRTDAKEEGFMIKKSGYTYKNKKSKGEIIDEAYVVTVTKEYNTVWEV